jgi:HD-GYP domain-containing protein (c-di-GMP phosphodiesterase class II)
MSRSTAWDDPPDLVPVSVEALRTASKLDFDLYWQRRPDAAPTLYRAGHVPILPADLQSLRERGIRTLYTPVATANRYRDHLRERVLGNEALPASDRFAILQEAARSAFDQALGTRNLDALAETSAELGGGLVDLVSGTRVLLSDLMGVLLHDYSTFTHSANTATYALMVAKGMGISDPQDLRDIATGALLHDVGKEMVPDDILSTPHRLCEDEQNLVRMHPQFGFEMLCQRTDLGWNTLMMIYQHHERWDGGGYPMGLVGREIHEWGRLCAVVDVFDDLLSDRPYRARSSVAEALKYLDHQGGRGFDEEIVRCLISLVNPNP